MNEVIKILPEDWVVTSIGEVIEDSQIGIVRSRELQNLEGNGVPYLKMNNVTTDGQVTTDDLVYVDVSDEELARYRIQEGDILFNTRNSSELVGKTGIANKNVCGFVYNNNLMRIRTKAGVVSKYLAYQMVSPLFRRNMEKVKRATTNIAAVYAKDLMFLPVYLAPPNQQKRIVAKIEELFSHIDAGIAALQSAKKLLKQYRQSVLKAAVTGELTKDWREANKDNVEPAFNLLERILKERRKRWEEQQLKKFRANGKIPKDDKWKEKYSDPQPALSKDQLPEGWVVVTSAQLAGHIVDGTHHTPTYVSEGVDFVSAKNVKDWKIDYSDTKKITLNEHAQLIGRCYPGRGDVLVTKSGTLGRVAVVKDDHIFSVFESVAVFPIIDKNLSEYIALAIHESVMGDAGQKIQKGIGVKHLHLEDLRKLEFWLPSKEELAEIFILFDKLSSASLRAEEAIDVQIAKAEKNRQSILSTAFSGKFINWD